MISIEYINNMLQSLRDFFLKWLIAFLLGLLGLLMVGSSIYNPSLHGSKAAQTVLVWVNRKKIRRFHVENAYEALKRQYQSSDNSQITPEIENDSRLAAVKQFVLMEVLKQRSYARSYRIHPEDALNLVKGTPAFQVDQQFSQQQFTKLLAAAGHSQTTFLKEVFESQVVNQLPEAIMRSAFVLPQEVNQVVRLIKQQRDFNYAMLKAEHFMPSDAQLPMESVSAYYDEHLSAFRVPEQVSIDYIMLSRTDVLNKIKAASTALLKEIEQTATEQFSQAVTRLTQLNDTYPGSLTEAAQALNIAVQSTPLFDRSGGSNALTQHPEIIKAAFSKALRQGRNSAVIHLDSERVLLLRLKQYQPLRLAALNEVEKQVRQQLSLHKAREAAQQCGEQLITQMKKNARALPPLPAHSQWRKVEKAMRDNQTIPAPLLITAFSMPYQGAVPSVQGVALPNGDYAVIQFSKLRYGRFSQLDDQQRGFYRDSLIAEMGQLDYIQYTYANGNRAKVTYFF